MRNGWLWLKRIYEGGGQKKKKELGNEGQINYRGNYTKEENKDETGNTPIRVRLKVYGNWELD